MQEQRKLEKKYEEMVEQRSNMKGLVNKTKYKEIQEEIQDISRLLRESTNNLVRSLKDNPNVSGNLIKVQRDRTELYDILLRCIQELRDRGVYYTILHKVEEENNARTRFQQLRIREKELRNTVSRLQENLNQEQKSFQRSSMEQKQAITQLKDELQVLKSSVSTDTKFKRKESAATVSAIWREYKHQERQLENKLKDIEEKLKTEQLVNEQTEDFLKRKQQSLIQELNSWDARYNHDVGEMDQEIRNIAGQRTILLEKLANLKNRRQIELREEAMKQEAEEAALRKMIADKELLVIQNRAARSIQREMIKYMKRKKEQEAIKAELKKKKASMKAAKKGKK
jgi:IQ domain-containing protein G